MHILRHLHTHQSFSCWKKQMEMTQEPLPTVYLFFRDLVHTTSNQVY